MHMKILPINRVTVGLERALKRQGGGEQTEPSYSCLPNSLSSSTTAVKTMTAETVNGSAENLHLPNGVANGDLQKIGGGAAGKKSKEIERRRRRRKQKKKNDNNNGKQQPSSTETDDGDSDDAKENTDPQQVTTAFSSLFGWI